MAREVAKAIFAYVGTEAGDLSFNEGDVIEVLDKSGDWWRGKTSDGRTGFFPYNRVEVVKQSGLLAASTSDMMGSLKVRNNGEMISKVAVELKDFKKNKRNQAVFEVEVTLANNDKVISEKVMTDFRRLDAAVQALDPQYEYKHTLPPSWADELPLSTKQAKSRAAALGKYLANNTHGREMLDMLIVIWNSADKAELKKATPTTNDVALLASDSKEDAKRKMLAALMIEYKKKKDRSTYDLFENGGNDREALGKLARVKFDWVQRDDMEINLTKYEYITVLQEKTKYDGWWYGQKANGKKGLFPFNYVHVLEPADVKKIFKPTKGAAPAPNNGAGGSRATNNTRMMSPTQELKYNKTTKKTPQMKPPPNANSSIENLKKKDSPAYGRPTDGGKSDVSQENLGSPKRSKNGRNRKVEDNYNLSCIEAFDELRGRFVTMESMGKLIKWKKKPEKGSPKKGDLVVLKFSSYVWNPQTQQLIEFSSSDKLKPPPEGVAQGVAGDSGKMMEFVVGKEETIDGLEEAVQQMEVQQTARVTIHPRKGYGDVGSPPEIPGNCFLVYDLTLTSVVNSEKIKPGRQAVFSVGISKPNVESRPQRSSYKEYRGFKSMSAYKGNDKKNKEDYYKKMGLKPTGKTDVDTETYKGKLTLRQVQDIVKKRSFEEFGVAEKKTEEYLTDAEFFQAFGMDQKAFLLLPGFKKKQIKKDLKVV